MAGPESEPHERREDGDVRVTKRRDVSRTVTTDRWLVYGGIAYATKKWMNRGIPKIKFAKVCTKKELNEALLAAMKHDGSSGVMKLTMDPRKLAAYLHAGFIAEINSLPRKKR